VLWHCWLGGRKNIQAVKDLSVGILMVVIWWMGTLHVLSSATCLPFWYQLSSVLLEYWLLNEGVMCVNSNCSVCFAVRFLRLHCSGAVVVASGDGLYSRFEVIDFFFWLSTFYMLSVPCRCVLWFSYILDC